MKNVLALALTGVVAGSGGLAAQDPSWVDEPEARIWLDRGDSPVLQRGDRVRVYYRTSQDAYVAIFHIDTDGVVRLLHPRGPGEDSFTRGGRDYRLLFPQWSYWYVDEYPGKGYYFLVASPWPLDLSSLDYARQDRSWDLTRVGRSVYRDPYLAMDDYVALLVPGWETEPYALDFLEYDVGETHEYPRFLCYDCHGFRSYVAWNPYTYACSSFRVVVWDDPYFYPALRYGPGRVVYTAPRRAVARFEFKERAQGESWAPLIRSREAGARRGVEFAEPDVAPGAAPDRGAVRRPPPSAGVAPAAGRATPTPMPQRRAGDGGSAGAAPARTPTARPGARPSDAAPSRAATPRSPGSRPSAAPPATTPRSGGTSQERPVLQRRPPASSGADRPPPAATRGGAASGASGTRVVVPPASRPTATPRPQARPSGGAASRPPAAAPSSRGSSTRAAPTRAAPAKAKPPARRPPGGGG